MQRLNPSFGAYTTLMPETLPIQARGQFSGLAGAGPRCHFWPSPSHIVLFSPSCRDSQPAGRITTTQHRTISPGLISTCTPTEDKTSASAPAFQHRLSSLFPIPCPPLPCYALALFVRVHLGEDEAITLQSRVTTVRPLGTTYVVTSRRRNLWKVPIASSPERQDPCLMQKGP